ncbi:MAG: Pyridoxamine 5-phosphate oxidase [Chthoniobacteraceae bacterium]|nr:Pyridoxamine 5-phosphate oxidase [Chthoniobacteraceae bacterium]
MLTSEQLASLRREYSLRPLRRADLDPEPIAQFNSWLKEAHEAEILEPNGMTLSTVDSSGQPWSRTVLLKICDERGFTFFTNYESGKGAQLADNPRAALTFWWGAMERQVNVTGSVTKSSTEESAQYFHSRPLTSQLGAWASLQSSVVNDRAQLERQFEEARVRFEGSEVPLPSHWGGYCLHPQTIEFWQGRRSRLHDRLRYTRMPAGSWRIERLSP